MKLYTVLIGILYEGLMWSDEVGDQLVVAAATGQDEAAIALEMR